MSRTARSSIPLPLLAQLRGLTSPRALQLAAQKGRLKVVGVYRGRGGVNGLHYEVPLDELEPAERLRALALYPEIRAPVAAELPVPAEKVRRKRSDRGKARVVISRCVDRGLAAGGVSAEGLAAFLEYLDGRCLDVWGQGTIGWAMVRDAVRPDLMAPARDLGFQGTDAELRAILDAIPRYRIETTMDKGKALFLSKKAAKKDNDRRPHLKLDWQQVPVGAVMQFDCSIGDQFYSDDAGHRRTGKVVAASDGSSGYSTLSMLECPKGQGLTMADVALEFARRVIEHQTLPGWLIIDNGPEFGWCDLPLLEDLLRAAWPDESLGLHPADLPKRRVIRTLRGRPAGKGMRESHFRLIKDACRDLPAFRFGPWSDHPTKNLLVTIKPVFSASEAALALLDRNDYINHRPMARHGGRSPAQLWAGRRRHDVDLIDIQTAISREKLVTIRQGGFTLDKRRYVADALAARPWLRKVLTYLPIFGDPWLIALRDPAERGSPFIGHARVEASRHPLDAAGARESARRRKLHVGAINELAARAIPVDISANLNIATAERRAAVERDAPPAPAAETISLNGAFGDAAEDRRRLNAEGQGAAPLPEPEPDWFQLRRRALRNEEAS